VLVVLQQTKTLCNMYLESEEHLQLQNKEIVLQASQAEVIHTTSTKVACQLRLLLIVSNLCGCSHQGMNTEAGDAVAEALLTASGHVQDAERMLQRMCCWLIMTAYCTLSALAKTLGSMQNTKAAYCILSGIFAYADEVQQAHIEDRATAMALLLTTKQTQEQVAAKRTRCLSWATGKQKKHK